GNYPPIEISRAHRNATRHAELHHRGRNRDERHGISVRDEHPAALARASVESTEWYAVQHESVRPRVAGRAVLHRGGPRYPGPPALARHASDPRAGRHSEFNEHAWRKDSRIRSTWSSRFGRHRHQDHSG